ncbi:AraC family transcriptional regulator [Cuneatibacter sp. NSJ-177]|uniref:AraC family transcriptional regulator n=1 Tax=Cuneatibacter sp. NSJ-177 TaxID=2931401 RepID=UPI001FD04BF7|nr:AraC family transcriptional regulator [Cuneatibacter sp. NSJ-177]MCJ7835047.1 AraC family transcriptional regulator [Cuneatibacter sp. NSJ-177]
MYIYDKPGFENSPFRQPPFMHITQVGHLKKVLPWIQYPHIHEDEYEISFIMNGSGILNLPGTVLPLLENSITIIPPKVAHCYSREQGDQEMEYYVIRFRADSSGSPVQRQLEALDTATAVSSEKIPYIQKLLDIILALAADTEGKIDETIQTISLSVLQMTSDELRRAGRTVITHTPVYANDILRYLQNHVGRTVTLEDLSREFNLSPSHISRVFLKTYHTSPIHYLIYCRMREARTYILNQNMPSQEIARKLAYKTTYHFVKAFENFYGCHPDQYLEFVAEIEP